MSNTEYKNHDICFLARIVLETETPLKTSSGKSAIKTDALINRDASGLPYIPATTLKGLMRHALADKERAKRIMGWQEKKDGQGSWLSVSEARLVVDGNGKVADGLLSAEEINSNEYLKGFREMPIRQHVKINHKGVAEKMGKFDEEIIPKGVRFCFEMELRADNEQGKVDITELLSILKGNTFRIGGGSRKGFGKVKIIDILFKELNLKTTEDLDAYIDKSSSLNNNWKYYEKYNEVEPKESEATHYQLVLHPVDFILFSSGFGDDKSDMSVVKEKAVYWDKEGPHWIEEEKSVVIPASSVKGAIAHRTAFYYNAGKGVKAEEIDNPTDYVGKNNEAVRLLFGSEGENNKGKRRGHVLISDVVETRSDKVAPKVINHVKIDRFTGGAIDGALFAEEPLYAKEKEIKLDLWLMPDDGDENINDGAKAAFEEALKDVCRGTLPLGGGVNRGNGCLKGTLTKNGNNVEL